MLAYFDIFTGISGDMILGALVDAGLPLSSLEETIAALGLSEEAGVTAQKMRKGSLMGTQVHVECRAKGRPHNGSRSDRQDLPARRLKEILALIQGASLPIQVRKWSTQVFQKLAMAEARVHGISVDEVHFHEVGAVDAIVDIVGGMAGLHALGVTRIVSSPVPLSRGYVQTLHGTLPIPAPATVALLAGCPVHGIDLDVETVTPTGAAIISTLAESFGPIPQMVPRQTGYGVGTFDLPIPNVFRLLLGEEAVSSAGLQNQTLSLLSTNVDNMSGEWFGPLFDQLLEAGALDVWLVPVQMKKNRPAVVIHLLAEPSTVPDLRLLLLRETTTLGVREERVSRWSLPRKIHRVETPWGEVRVKVASLPDGSEKAAPEFEDCLRLAQAHQIPLRQVYETALQSRAVDTDGERLQGMESNLEWDVP